MEEGGEAAEEAEAVDMEACMLMACFGIHNVRTWQVRRGVSERGRRRYGNMRSYKACAGMASNVRTRQLMEIVTPKGRQRQQGQRLGCQAIQVQRTRLSMADGVPPPACDIP